MTSVLYPPKVGHRYRIIDGLYKGRLARVDEIHHDLSHPKLKVTLCDAWGDPELGQIVVPLKHLGHGK